MNTLQLDEKHEVTISAFKDRDRDTIEIKIRVLEKDTLAKRGIILALPIEILQSLDVVPPMGAYRKYNLTELLNIIKNAEVKNASNNIDNEGICVILKQ